MKKRYYPRSAFRRIGPNRYYLDVPGLYIDLDRIPPGYTVNAFGEVSRRPRKRSTRHRRSR